MAQPLGKPGRSVRLFALLVRILPSDFRVRHGSQIIQTFQDCRREVVSRGGVLNLVRFWRNAFADLLWTALILHTERFTMSTSKVPTHLAILISPWVLFQRISATNNWLERFRPYPKAFRKPLQFAWYEARAYSSAQIQPEHLLLGLLRATTSVRRHVSPGAIGSAIAVIDAYTGHGRGLGYSVPSDPSVDALSQRDSTCVGEGRDSTPAAFTAALTARPARGARKRHIGVPGFAGLGPTLDREPIADA